MDLMAKYLSETCSDPIEYLRQLRQTTEPIGGDTEYCEDGELIEYDVAIEAIKKANDAFIEKAEEYLYKQLNEGNMECGDIETFIEDFEEYLKK